MIPNSTNLNSSVIPGTSKKVSYIPVLDGWRAVAILLVLLFHGLYNSDTGGGRYIRAFSLFAGRTGALGVLIFFCISGYLITQKMLSESSTTGAFSLRDFYIKRVFRIVPPLAVYLAVLVILFAAGVLSLQIGDWSAPMFITNYYPGSWYTSHFWSLSVEEHFYLFWPFCIIVAGWRRAMWIGIAIIVAVGVWRPWELKHVASVHVLQHTDMRLDYIMMGCVVALLLEFYPVMDGMLRALGSTLGLLCLFALLVVTTLHLPFEVRSLQAVILTLLVCSSANGNSRLLNLLIANPVMLFIGRISYSLYIWQQLFLGPSTHPIFRSPAALILKFPIVLLVACLSFYFVERPLIRYGRRFIKKQQNTLEDANIRAAA